jgi:hypothetical protein
MGAVALVIAAVIATGASSTASAVARNVPRHIRVPVAFSHPVGTAEIRGGCYPGTTQPCPSTNALWSGYVLSPFDGHTFTSVSASWVQPKVTCPVSNAWTLFWDGIDGYTYYGDSGTVEQGGTSAQCIPGQPVQYEAWWEMYPTNAVTPEFPINVGDHINASVVYSSTAFTYTITVDDLTTSESLDVVVGTSEAATAIANTYTVTINQENENPLTTGPTSFAPGTVCSTATPCDNTSAEFVVEAPGDNGTPDALYPLAKYRRVVFQGTTAGDSSGNGGSITNNAWQYTALDLLGTDHVDEAIVNPVHGNGTRFRDMWIST